MYILSNFDYKTYTKYGYTKNTGHLEWNALGDFSEFKTNGDSKEAL